MKYLRHGNGIPKKQTNKVHVGMNNTTILIQTPIHGHFSNQVLHVLVTWEDRMLDHDCVHPVTFFLRVLLYDYTLKRECIRLINYMAQPIIIYFLT